LADSRHCGCSVVNATDVTCVIKSSRADSVCARGGLEGVGASFPSSSQYYFTCSSIRGQTVRFSVVFLDV